MRSALRTTVAAAVLLAGAIIGTPAQAAPDPSQVYIESITYGGTGCPQGTVGQSISDDRTTATLIFDNFVASAGPGVPVTEGRKNCQLNINLHVPRSRAWVADIVPTERGYVQVGSGATATRTRQIHTSTPILPWKPRTTSGSGPIAADYASTTTYHQGDASLLCTDAKALPDSINEQVALATPATPGQVTLDSFDISIKNVATLPCR